MSLPNGMRCRITVDVGYRGYWLLGKLLTPGNGIVGIGERGQIADIVRRAIDDLAAAKLKPELLADAPSDAGRTKGRRFKRKAQPPTFRGW